MIERNFRNAIIWEEPDGQELTLRLEFSDIDTEEFREIFDRTVRTELVREDESLENNLP